MTKTELLTQGIKEKIIAFDNIDNPRRVTYLLQNKSRNYKSENIVQVEAYLKLIFEYNYPKENINVFSPVQMGADNREADIIVFSDSTKENPYIVVECKTEEVSNAEYRQAVEQAFSYASSLRADFVWTTSGINNHYYQISENYPQKKTEIANIPKQYGTIKTYKYIKGGGESYFELKKVDENDLTRRFKQAHNALWAGGELDPSAAFDELDKLIFCKLMDEKNTEIGKPYGFQFIQRINKSTKEAKAQKGKNYQDAVDELAQRIDKIYQKGLKKDEDVFKDNIRLSPQKIKTVVGYLEEVDLGKTDLDSKGRAFETFMDSFFRGTFGQFFTPRNIVQFVVDVLPINDASLVLDTSCGSGGFLLHTLDKVRKQADNYYNEETPEHYRHWHDFAQNNLFGIEINEQIARVAKMNMIIHDDGHTNVVSCDGLLPVDNVIKKDQHGNDIVVQEGIKKRTGNTGLKPNRFDFIITNPPFGSTIKQVEQAYSSHYDVFHKEINWLEPASKRTQRPNQNTEVLFIEQCYYFLKVGGYLAIVIPDGILTSSSMQYVRDWIADYFRIIAFVSLPQTAFSHVNAGVKSSVMFLKKYDKKITEDIQEKRIILQNQIKERHQFTQQLDNLNQAKNLMIKRLDGFDKPANLSEKEIRKTHEFKAWKTQTNKQFKEKINTLKETLQAEYEAEKKLNDYPIFMAIAEEIGYDTTGKPINKNELEIIGKELVQFIEMIEKGEA